MAGGKITGLGERFFLAQVGANGVGLDISGDVGSIDGANLTMADLDSTGIDKTYHERLPGLVDADLSYTAHFNAGAGNSYLLQKALVGLDGAAIWSMGAAEGSDGFAIQGIIDTFAVTGAANGDLTIKPKLTSDAGIAGFCILLMNATDVAPATHAGADEGAASSFGGALFAILLGLTGTNVILTLWDSADGVTYLAVSPGVAVTFTGSGTGYAVVETGATATIRQYVQIRTTGTFSSANLAAAWIRY